MDRLSFYLLDALFHLDPAVGNVGDDGAVTRHVRAAVHRFEAEFRHAAMCQPREETRRAAANAAWDPRTLNFPRNIGERHAEQQFREDEDARPRNQHAAFRGRADVARDIASGVADADDANPFPDIGFRLAIIMRVQVLAFEVVLEHGHVHGHGEMARGGDHRRIPPSTRLRIRVPKAAVLSLGRRAGAHPSLARCSGSVSRYRNAGRT